MLNICKINARHTPVAYGETFETHMDARTHQRCCCVGRRVVAGDGRGGGGCCGVACAWVGVRVNVLVRVGWCAGLSLLGAHVGVCQRVCVSVYAHRCTHVCVSARRCLVCWWIGLCVALCKCGVWAWCGVVPALLGRVKTATGKRPPRRNSNNSKYFEQIRNTNVRTPYECTCWLVVGLATV